MNIKSCLILVFCLFTAAAFANNVSVFIINKSVYSLVLKNSHCMFACQIHPEFPYVIAPNTTLSKIDIISVIGLNLGEITYTADSATMPIDITVMWHYNQIVFEQLYFGIRTSSDEIKGHVINKNNNAMYYIMNI